VKEVVCEHVEDVSVEYSDFKGKSATFKQRGEDVPEEATLGDMVLVLKSFDAKAEQEISVFSNINHRLKKCNDANCEVRNKIA